MFNPKSLDNLKKGNTGYKRKTTKVLVENITDYLTTNREYFEDQMILLSPKDYCNVFIKMIGMIIPKKLEASVEATEMPKFEIHLASSLDTDKLK